MAKEGQPVIKSRGSHTFPTLHCECLHSVLKLLTNKQLYVFMSLLKTLCKHSQCIVEKACELLDLITVWPSFGSNNLNPIFPVVADQTCTTFKRNFGTFLFTNCFSSAIFLGCLVWTGLLRSCHSISSPKPWYYLHHSLQLWWGFDVGALWLFFSTHSVVCSFQTTQL